jgi:hypothetical protein
MHMNLIISFLIIASFILKTSFLWARLKRSVANIKNLKSLIFNNKTRAKNKLLIVFNVFPKLTI